MQILVAEQEIMVCTEVKIVNIGNSGSFRLPWASGQEQEYQLLAEGGRLPCAVLSDHQKLSVD